MGCHFLLQGIFPTQESTSTFVSELQADSLLLSEDSGKSCFFPKHPLVNPWTVPCVSHGDPE